MKIVKKVGLLFMTLCLLLAVGCGQANKKELTLGETKNNVYTNEFFGLEAKIPEGWINLDRNTIDEMTKMGADIVANGDADKKEQLKKLSEEKTLNFIMAYKYELGKEKLNPSITINSEKVSLLQGIDTSEKYLQVVAEQLKGIKNIPYTVSDTIVTQKINDVDWSLLEASIDLGNGNKFMQKYYSVLKDGYIINVITSYAEEDGKNELEQAIKDLKINKK